MLWDSRYSHNINNVIHATYITYVFKEGSSFRSTSDKCEFPCLQQKLECERKAEPQNCEADDQKPWFLKDQTLFLIGLNSGLEKSTRQTYFFKNPLVLGHIFILNKLQHEPSVSSTFSTYYGKV